MEKIGSAEELGELLGVTGSAIRNAQKNGRFVRSVVPVENHHKERYRYHLALACYEWISNKQHNKDRRGSIASKSAITEQAKAFVQAHTGESEKKIESVMPLAESNAIDRHYAALLKKVDYHERIKELIPVDKFRQEAFQAARSVRDALSYLPQETSAELKRLTLSLLRKHLAEEGFHKAQKDLDAMTLEFKKIQKASIKKALYELVNSRLGTEELKVDTEGGKG